MSGTTPEDRPRSAWQDSGSIFERAKHPVSTSGEAVADADPRADREASDAAAEQGAARGPVNNDSALLAREGAGSRDPGDLVAAGPLPSHAEDSDARAERRAERRVATWFMASVVFTILWMVVYFADRHPGYLDLGIFTVPYDGQLGLTMGLAMICLGVGIVDWAKSLMPHEDAVQERHPFASPLADREAAEATFAEGIAVTGGAKRPLLRRTLLLAGALVPLPFVVALRSLGPLPGKTLDHTDWSPGARLVDADGSPVKLGSMEIGAIRTVWPENHTDSADAVAILIRLREGEDRPKPGREGYGYFGHVVYSKICTHAGCPISLYEQQTHHLLCPCHQSTFDILDHAKPIFGPATRPLPQLAIDVDAEGYFVAKKDFDEPVGPGFWERS